MSLGEIGDTRPMSDEPFYRQGDEIVCALCGRRRVMASGECEKCGWLIEWNQSSMLSEERKREIFEAIELPGGAVWPDGRRTTALWDLTTTRTEWSAVDTFLGELAAEFAERGAALQLGATLRLREEWQRKFGPPSPGLSSGGADPS